MGDIAYYKDGYYNATLNSLDYLIKKPINEAVHDRTHARYGTTKLNSTGSGGAIPNTTIADTTIDPKYKFFPKVAQQKAEETFVKEVERVSAIIQAGDTRTIELVFGGIHKDPNQNATLPTGTPINTDQYVMPDLFGDDAVFIAINYHGLISSEIVKKGTMPVDTNNPTFHDYINGNTFSPSNGFVEADYTEHLQN